MSVWIDQTKIKPGTPDWEIAIRDGIRRSFAVVLLASPASSVSPYVRAEYTLARSRNLPVFPVWIHGNQWSESIGLDLVHTQYIDLRHDREDFGLQQLYILLKTTYRNVLPDFIDVNDMMTMNEGHHKFAEIPPDYIGILLEEPPIPKKGYFTQLRGSFVRVSEYKLIGHLLDDIYARYLSTSHEPFTYLTEWLLFRQRGGEVLAPLSWLDGKCSITELDDWKNTNFGNAIFPHAPFGPSE